MSTLISKPAGAAAALAQDDFLLIAADEALPASGHLLVPLARWQAARDGLLERARRGGIGVWLTPDEGPETLAADLADLSLIACHFPASKFGQPYSTAVLLRTRYGYRGALRAFGDIGQDQLFPLARCGFDQFLLPADKSPASALTAFASFSVVYQTSADGHPACFRERAA